MIAKVRTSATRMFLRIDPKYRPERCGGYGGGQAPPLHLEAARPERNRKSYFKAAARVEPRSAGVSTVRMPAAAIAAYLSLAVPWPPLMMAPASPMRRPGAARWPAVEPTTGSFTL